MADEIVQICRRRVGISMKFADRMGNIKGDDNGQDVLIQWMYGTLLGRVTVKMLINPMISRLGGKILSTKLSSYIIPSFCKKNGIDLSEYEKQEFSSYNDFFTRKIKTGKRPVEMKENMLISPCDAKLSVYKIDTKLRFAVKHTMYTVPQLLKDKKIAEKYQGGYAAVFRLTVDDYHRYAYIDAGVQSKERYIKGVLHTVNPAANDIYPIYKENSRCYSILKTDNFGEVLMMEVGALMVGKIVNYTCSCQVKRGQEKGHFEFGGSTIILLFEKGKTEFDRDILQYSKIGIETKVKLGEVIGKSGF